MTPAEQFEAWRSELAIELETAIDECSTAQATLEAAQVAHGEARTAWHDLDKFAAAGMRSPTDGVPGPLHSRLLNARAALMEAESARGTALGAVKGLEQRVKSLQDSIEFADRSLTAAKVAQLPRGTQSSRRRAAPVQFDNIVLPREAVP
jgi:hypothetical protein